MNSDRPQNGLNESSTGSLALLSLCATSMMRTALLACFVSTVSAHCRGLDRMALIKLYESLGGASWTNNRNWNTTTGTSEENKQNDPCDPKKRWYGVGFYDPCEKYLDDIIGSGPETDYLTQVRGSMQGCFAGRITSLCATPARMRVPS